MPCCFITAAVRASTREMPDSPTNMWCASSVSMKRQVRDSGSKPDSDKAFNRHIGTFAGQKVSPDGRVISEAEWAANVRNWLPSEEDRAYVASLMGRVVEPGKMANWIAPPPVGINRQPVDFEYVRFN